MSYRMRWTGRGVVAVALACLLQAGAAWCADGKEFKTIIDARKSMKTARPSAAETALLNREIVPAAERYWKGEGKECEPDFRVVDVARGSFTRASSDQKAFLYSYCQTAHNFGLDGIAVVEKGRVVAHVAYAGAWDMGIQALPDIDRDGLSELMIVTGGINMGDVWQSVAVIQINGARVTKFGGTQTFDDDCKEEGGGGPATASRILASYAATPAFERESYQKACGESTWKETEKSPLTLEDDEVEYELVR